MIVARKNIVKSCADAAKEAKPPPKEATPRPSLRSPSGDKKPYDQWSFGLFGGTGSRWVSVALFNQLL